MTELLRHVFGWVCGQDPAHTWSPGGELLPLCQRCTGVYAGAFAAALLHLAWRPAPAPRWLWLNGAFLLFILPSGFHWIPQNAVLRCTSGILFGFGLIAFLWLTLPHKNGMASDKNSRSQLAAFAAGLIVALVFTPRLAENGNAIAAGILTVACAVGAVVLAVLLFANLLFLLRWLARKILARAA
jgi:uncharacterized membrane protein